METEQLILGFLRSPGGGTKEEKIPPRPDGAPLASSDGKKTEEDPPAPPVLRYPWEERIRRTEKEAEKKSRKPEKKPSRDAQISLNLPKEGEKKTGSSPSPEWAQVPAGEENLWKRDDVPHDGWTCVDVIDLGEPSGVCRMCGRQIIRYVHVMRHPDYPRTIGAGCVCAGRMEGDPERAKAREAAFKNRLARRETFLALKPRLSRGGNRYVRYKNEAVTLLADRYRPGMFKAVVRENTRLLSPRRRKPSPPPLISSIRGRREGRRSECGSPPPRYGNGEMAEQKSCAFLRNVLPGRSEGGAVCCF